MEDFYELLGVSEDASTDEIDQAWRERVHQYHPDVNDDTRANAQFKTVKTAHEVLSDETERSAYDRLGHETYVQERLDGLPTARHPATDDSTGTAREDSGEGGTDDADTSDRRDTTGSTRSGRTDSRSRGSGRSATDAGTNERTRTTSGRTTRGREGTDARADGTSSAATAKRRTRPRRPLAYGWAAVALAGVVYLLGLQAYLSVNAAALSTLAEASPSAIPTVLGAYDLVAPGTFVLDAVATGGIFPLVFAAGAVGLAVGFLAVVASFGHGAAYLYAVGGLTPAAALAIGPIVAAPDGAVLLLAVVIPVATVVLFLVDVGRELLAGP